MAEQPTEQETGALPPQQPFFQQIHDAVGALLGKLEGFKHPHAPGFKARLESIFTDTKEYL